jgi:hypothetical protein
MGSDRDHTEFVNWLLEHKFIEVPESVKFFFGAYGEDRVFVHRSKVYVSLRWETGKGFPDFYYFYLNYFSDVYIPTDVSLGQRTEDIKKQISRFTKVHD